MLSINANKNRDTSGGLTISEQQAKINNNRAKVELALGDALQSKDFPEQTGLALEALIRDYPDLEPELKSVCYQKLGSLQFELLESNKTVQTKDYARMSTQYTQIVENCRQATIINPCNAEAWHYFSTTNEEASIFYSRQFSKEHAKTEDKIKEYQLHREFGH